MGFLLVIRWFWSGGWGLEVGGVVAFPDGYEDHHGGMGLVIWIVFSGRGFCNLFG